MSPGVEASCPACPPSSFSRARRKSGRATSPGPRTSSRSGSDSDAADGLDMRPGLVRRGAEVTVGGRRTDVASYRWRAEVAGGGRGPPLVVSAGPRRAAPMLLLVLAGPRQLALKRLTSCGRGLLHDMTGAAGRIGNLLAGGGRQALRVASGEALAPGRFLCRVQYRVGDPRRPPARLVHGVPGGLAQVLADRAGELALVTAGRNQQAHGRTHGDPQGSQEQRLLLHVVHRAAPLVHQAGARRPAIVVDPARRRLATADQTAGGIAGIAGEIAH